MKFLKTEFTRYFAVGFIAGTVAIAAMTNIDLTSTIAHEVVPAAVAAAPAR